MAIIPPQRYGIFLNTFGASIFTYNLQTYFKSETATLNNIIIHDMSHEMIEYERFYLTGTGNIFISPFNSPIHVRDLIDIPLNQNINIDKFTKGEISYKGNILTDAYNELHTKSWQILIPVLRVAFKS